MIYLDYASNCPVDKEVLDKFNYINKNYIGNPNSIHKLGLESKKIIDTTTKNIADRFNILEDEIIYTSGATESNNLAISGLIEKNKHLGNHIITTQLEHPSIISTINKYKDKGFEVDYIDILPNGLIDMELLEELIRDSTILVSISYVDSVLGIKQNIEELAQFFKSYPNCYFHTDATQAVGKIDVNFKNIDLVTFAPHKFFGLSGVGVLIKKQNIELDPIILGGNSTTNYRGGTPNTALISSIETSLDVAYRDMDKKYKYVEKLNKILRENLSSYSNIKINSTLNSIPFILNFSILNIDWMQFLNLLNENDVYLSTRASCCPINTISKSVYALTCDKKRSFSSFRISLSHITTEDEVRKFLEIFDYCYKELKK